MKNLIVALAAAGFVPFAFANKYGVLDTTANTYTITVAANATVTLNDDDVTALGTGVTLVKEGDGRLIIATDLKTAGYDGEIQVKAGYLQPQEDGPLGGTGKGTIISPGASLELYRTSTAYDNMYPAEPITVGGNGVGGHGAIYCVKGGYGVANRQMLYGPVTFTADTKLGYDGDDASVRGGCIFATASGQKLDMGGHTLTFVTHKNDIGIKSGFSRVANGSFANPGHIVVGEDVRFVFENYFELGGDSSNTFTLKKGSSLRTVGGYPNHAAWTLIVDGDASMPAWNSTDTYAGCGWGGPVTLNAKLTVGDRTSHFYGKISGTGSLAFADSCKAVLSGDSSQTNTYTGGTTFANGCNVTFAAPGLLPRTGTVTVGSSSKIAFRPASSSDLPFYTDETVTALSRFLMPLVDRASEVYIYGTVANWPASFTDSLPVDGTASAVTYSGFLTNAVGRFTGTMSGAVDLKVRPKTLLSIESDVTITNSVEVNGGTLTIPKNVTLTATNVIAVGGANASNIGRLKIEGTLNLNSATKANRAITASSQLLKANVRSTERGIVEVCSGATVNGYFGPQRGNNASESGTKCAGVYLVKGTVNAAVASAYIGDYRSEYLEIADGGVLNSGSLLTGRGWCSYANLRIRKGGTFASTGSGDNAYQLSADSGLTDVLIDGGRFISPNSTVGMNYSGTRANAYTSLTICDNGEMRLPNKTADKGWCSFVVNNTPSSINYLNLADGGFLETTRIQRGNPTDCRAIVSFNGGTYAMRYNSRSDYQRESCFYNFVVGEGTAGDHVFVFAKGATISNTTPTSIGFPLEAPTGKGIESIALPSEIANMAAWAIHGAPMVRISDTTGYGASAVALYDAESGKVTAIKVTSRGVNYTNPTIRLSMAGLTATSYADCCTLTDNVSGGFTKTGSSTLTVNHTNSYTGVTTVRQGTLKLGCDSVLDSSSGIVVESGATLDLNGKSCAPAITGYGQVSGDVTLAASWTIDGAELAAAESALTVTGNVTIPAAATITVTNPEALDPNQQYTLVTASGTLTGTLPTVVSASDVKLKLIKTDSSLLLKVQHGLTILLK